jgi:hypothetical protein
MEYRLLHSLKINLKTLLREIHIISPETSHRFVGYVHIKGSQNGSITL